MPADIRILFTGAGQVEVAPLDLKPLESDEVLIRARVSLISNGTEGICLYRNFEPGSHFDRWVQYPFRSGYCMVADVVEVGNEVTSVQPGQRVVARVTHASATVTKATQCFPVPDGVTDEDAAWFALAMIGFMPAKNAPYRMGDDILVVGAGPIGQMTSRWALAAGARRVVVIDPRAERLEFATRGGVTAVIAGTVGESHAEIEAAFEGNLPEIVVDSTGFAPVFRDCLATVANRGRLVLLGDTGQPSDQRLTPDVVVRGVQIIGCHITHEEDKWREPWIVDFFFNLVKQGRYRLDGMVTHTFAPEQAPEAYRLISRESPELAMGIQFDWRNR